MLKLAKNHLKTALLFGLLAGALSFLVLVTTQKSFRGSADILMSQNQAGATDYYALSQGANYLTNILSQSIYSEKFLEEVDATGKISTGFLGNDNATRLKEWQRVVHVKNNSSVGIMNIQVFGDTQFQTDKLSEAVIDVLVNHNSFFLGQEQNVNVRILSGPIVEKNPSIAQIVAAAVGGFAVGMLFFLLFVIYRAEFFPQEELADEELSIKMDQVEKQIFPLENFPPEPSISDEDYLAADSDYWKDKLENKKN